MFHEKSKSEARQLKKTSIPAPSQTLQPWKKTSEAYNTS
jgi:hypothetical protein